MRTYQAAVHDLSESLASMAQTTLPMREIAAASISADELDTLKRKMTDQLNIPRRMLDRIFKT